MERLSRITLALLLTEGSFSCVKASQSLGLFSHDQLTRELAKEVVYTAVLTPLEALPKAGDLSVDDTVVAKPHANEIEGLEGLSQSCCRVEFSPFIEFYL